MTRRVFQKLCTKKVCADFLAPSKNFQRSTHTRLVGVGELAVFSVYGMGQFSQRETYSVQKWSLGRPLEP